MQVGELGFGQLEELGRRFVEELIGQLVAELLTIFGESHGFDAAISWRWLSFHEPAFFETIDEPRDVRRVAAPLFGERAHRLRLAGFEGQQGVHVRWCEPVLERELDVVVAVRNEERPHALPTGGRQPILRRGCCPRVV